MSRDGNGGIIFHEKCDNQGPTLLIVETINKYKFGGYTSKNWDKDKLGFVKDEDAFVFSISNRKKYPVKDSDKAICNLKYGISFGDMDIDLFYYDEKKEISSFNQYQCRSMFPKSYKSDKQEESNGKLLLGKTNITIPMEIEVFKLILD